MHCLWQLQYSIDANDLSNLPVKKEKIMLLALLKMVFFYAVIADSSKVTPKLREKMPSVAGGGSTLIQYCCCYPARYCYVCQEALSVKVPFLQCSCPVLGSWLHKWTIWRLWSIIFPITLPAGSLCPLLQLAARMALPCHGYMLKSITLIIQEGRLMGADG